MTGGRNLDGQVIHRHRTGDEADRTGITPLDGELIVVTDGPSPKVYAGAGAHAGGYMVGPAGRCFLIHTAGTDIGTLTPIAWNSQGTVTEEFSHSVSVNNSEVTVLADGEYEASCEVSVLFSGSTTFEVDVQRYNGAVWTTLSGGRSLVTSTSGNYVSIRATRSVGLLAGWKLRALAFNYLFATGNTALVASFCNFNISRTR